MILAGYLDVGGPADTVEADGPAHAIVSSQFQHSKVGGDWRRGLVALDDDTLEIVW